MQTLGMITSMLACAREVSELCIDVHDIEQYCTDRIQQLIQTAANHADKSAIGYYDGIIDGYTLAGVIAMSIVDEYYQELLKND